MLHHGDLPRGMPVMPGQRDHETMRPHGSNRAGLYRRHQELTRRLAAVSRAELVTLITDLADHIPPGAGIDLVPAGLIAGRGQNDRELAHLGERAMTSWWSWATGRNVA